MTNTMTQETTADRPPRKDHWIDIFWALPAVARWTVYSVLGLVLLLVLATLAGAGVVRSSFPEKDGAVDVPGLDGRVQVLRDANGIPQIYASTMADLMRGQGYVHAQERFFEMDVRRHITSGRLAEMFGPSAVEVDRTVRTMGWRRVAEKELGLVSPDTRRALDAYAEGVNAYLAGKDNLDLAVEYGVLAAGGLDYTPEPWTAVDSLAWLKAMAWDLRSNMTQEIERVLVGASHSPTQVAELFPDYDERRATPIVTQGAVVDGVFEQDATRAASRNPARPGWSADQADLFKGVQRALDRLPALVGRGDGIGSNSWVVDGQHSATGQPLLANDPHLATGVPGIWMQMGLHCTEVSPSCPMDASGFTFSGVPGVIIGHNRDIAWGFTNLAPDVSDLYLERIRGNRWRYDGGWRPLKTRTETIEVAGEEPVEITVRETAHGPLLSDADPQLRAVNEAERPPDAKPSEEYAVSLQWTALEPSATADAILGFNKASNWAEFRSAAEDFAVPSQNLIYADRSGRIGYQAPGRIPIRKSGNDGTTPSEGWRPENDWTGDYIPFDGLPSVLDPEEGFIVTANQKVIGEDYPYFLTDDWDMGYRSQRIRDLIEQEGELTVAEMADLQLDDRNPLAPALVPRLLDVEDVGGDFYTAGLRLLERWDYRQGADSAAAAYFNAVWRALLERTFADDLPEEVVVDGGDRWMAVVTELLDDPANRWWDDARTDGQVETRDDILRTAIRDARRDLTRRMGPDPDQWAWGRLHRLNLRNNTLGVSGVGPVEWLVNRTDFPASGGSAAVNATSWDASLGYEVTAAPSMRMVVSMADLDDSRWINLTGVSGHPFDKNYTDQTELWLRGETLAWPFSREAVDATTEDTLTLEPAPPESAGE